MHLTLKQQLFLERYVKTLSATQAAYEVYRCKNRNVAGVIGHQNLRKLNIRHVLDHTLRLAGLTENTLAQALERQVDLGSFTGIKQTLKLLGYRL